MGEGKSAEPEPSGPPSATSIQAAAAAEAGRLSREAAHGGNKVETASEKPVRNNNGKHRSLATPAVRHICKELGVTIEEVIGTGKDGRVLKEDVTRFASSSSANSRSSAAGILEPGLQAASSPGGLKNPESQITNSRGTPTRPVTPAPELAQETTQPLTRIQSEMFKIMTASLSIPHFLYSDEICLNSITSLRSRLNKDLAKSAAGEAGVDAVKKLTLLPFIIKSVSVSLSQYPLLNSRLDTSSPVPQLITRPSHNIGIAMDTPLGLLVPNIKSVQQLSILEIAAELQRLQSLGAAGKLSPADLRGGTITVSNIGSIGGTVVAPVIVPSEVAILGVGRGRFVPAFDGEGKVEKREIVNFSWSADHRVVDGATMARMAARVRELVEEPERLLVRLR